MSDYRIKGLLFFILLMATTAASPAPRQNPPHAATAQQTQKPLAPVRAEQPGADTSDPGHANDMARQLQAALDAHKRGDTPRFNALIDEFSLSDPEKWLAENFGALKALQLATKYEEALSNFQSHIIWVAESWTSKSPLELRVEPAEMAKPAADVGPENALPKPLAPMEIRSFRFTVNYGDQALPSWVDSFVYEDGTLRFIGGTVPFWAEELHGLRTPQPTSPMESGSQPSEPKTVQRIRVGGNVQQAKALHMVQPVYPADAKYAHIQGTVVLHGIIGKDGSITQLDLISGPPPLIKSAMDAVWQWKYQATLLSGKPAEVDTTISVVFTLGK
jgi:hypothetical protein